jgi:hypothetical protein
MNDSSTGGYLIPSGSAPLEGQALLDFLQGVIVGITGLAGNMVRPYFQSEPPNVPDAGTAWCAFRIGERPSDRFPYVRHNPDDADGQGSDTLQRQEALHVHCSFYDLGSGGLADGLASLLRDGFSIAQNREVLTLNNMGLAYTGELTPVPVPVKDRWLYRVDIEVVIRRQINRTYSVLSVLSAQGTLVSSDGQTRNLGAPDPAA